MAALNSNIISMIYFAAVSTRKRKPCDALAGIMSDI